MPIELSGDVRLSPADRLRYLIRNACRNLPRARPAPRSRFFQPDRLRAQAIAEGQSPGRLLTELFLESELPRLIERRELTVLELGCGSGSMAARLVRLGFRGRYTGIDIKDRFNRAAASALPLIAGFVEIDAHEFTPAEKLDLMLSVSTLEHIPDDGRLIARLPTFFRRGGLEIHVVPSGASLGLYLWHGFRQYTAASLAQKFGSDIEVVQLGGLGSYLVHFGFVTLPDLLLRRSVRKAAPAFYRRALLAALRLDPWLPIFPCAYAVIRRH
ncbi:MAG: class I SAM-dependent methyltransferase [Pseudolabrys sp.]